MAQLHDTPVTVWAACPLLGVRAVLCVGAGLPDSGTVLPLGTTVQLEQGGEESHAGTSAPWEILLRSC